MSKYVARVSTHFEVGGGWVRTRHTDRIIVDANSVNEAEIKAKREALKLLDDELKGYKLTGQTVKSVDEMTVVE